MPRSRRKAEVTVTATHTAASIVEADSTQLHQVLMSLMTNASDALGDQSGQITVTTGRMRIDPDVHQKNTVGNEDLAAGEYAFHRGRRRRLRHGRRDSR